MRMTDKIVRRMHTATGFGLDVVETSIVDAGGKVYEHRLGAFYKFLEWGAVALVRATDRARFEAHKELFVTLFQAGRPDFRASGRVMCLHDLFGGIAVDPPEG